MKLKDARCSFAIMLLIGIVAGVLKVSLFTFVGQGYNTMHFLVRQNMF